MLLFDMKGEDYNDEEFIQETNGIRLDPAVAPIPIDLFEVDPEVANSINQTALTFCNIIEKIFSNFGPVQKNHLKIF